MIVIGVKSFNGLIFKFVYSAGLIATAPIFAYTIV